MKFAAIDFETADHGRDSACAVGVVRVEDGQIVSRLRRLIRPPRREFFFTYIHGLSWSDCAEAPTFAQLWPELSSALAGVDFLAAHNAPFDKGVLSACCGVAGVPAPPQPFVCTVSLARKTWNIRPTRLPDVCQYLGIELKHHEALSDAEACARIVVAAHKQGAAFAPA